MRDRYPPLSPLVSSHGNKQTIYHQSIVPDVRRSLEASDVVIGFLVPSLDVLDRYTKDIALFINQASSRRPGSDIEPDIVSHDSGLFVLCFDDLPLEIRGFVYTSADRDHRFGLETIPSTRQTCSSISSSSNSKQMPPKTKLSLLL